MRTRALGRSASIRARSAAGARSVGAGLVEQLDDAPLALVERASSGEAAIHAWTSVAAGRVERAVRKRGQIGQLARSEI